MIELKEHMRALDLIEPPELWHRVGASPTTVLPQSRSRLVAAVVMLFVATAAAWAVRSAYLEEASTLIKPGPKPNGPIYFLSDPDRITGQRSLFTVNSDGSHFREISLHDGSFVRVAVSPGGRRIAMSTGGFDTAGDIYVMNADGSGLRRLTNDPPGSGPWGGHHDNDPAWSPDGRNIVFASSRCCDSERSLSGYALYDMRPDGSRLHQVTDGSQSAWSPAWSPDGSLIAYTADLQGLWVIGADGSDPRALTHDGRFVKAMAWSPDGREIAYLTQGRPTQSQGAPGSKPEDFQVRIVARDGSRERTIYTCHELCRFGGSSVAWSPDGKEIAFVFGRVRGKGIVWQIGLVAPDGTGFRVLNTLGRGVSDMTWASAT